MVDRELTQEEAANEVYEMAAKIHDTLDAFLPDARTGLVINALVHYLATIILAKAFNADAARNTAKLLGDTLEDNVDNMLRQNWGSWVPGHFNQWKGQQ